MTTKAKTGCLFCAGKTPPPGGRCRHCGREGEPAVHRCHADGCSIPIAPKLLMCRKHWYLLPPLLRAEVWREYVPGQEITKTPTQAYLGVMKRAIDHVARAEGRR